MKQAVNEICIRCGSPRGILKTWNEVIETISGSKSDIEIIQTICTNSMCQEAFDKDRALTIKRQEELKAQKQERDDLRKTNALSQANEARKHKSRI